MRAGLATGVSLLLFALLFLASGAVRAQRRSHAARNASTIIALVADAVPAEVVRYLESTKDSSGQRRNMAERLRAVLPRQGAGAELRAIVEFEIRIADVERRITDECVSVARLNYAVLLATSIALTIIATVWLVFTSLGLDRQANQREPRPATSSTTTRVSPSVP